MRSARFDSGVRRCCATLLLAIAGAVAGQADTYPRQAVDVLHYDVDIEFDETFAYDATVEADVRLLAPGVKEIHFDLDRPTVQDVRGENGPLSWTHEKGRLTIALGQAPPRESIVPLTVHYTGRPDGRSLVARPNAHGQQGALRGQLARGRAPVVAHGGPSLGQGHRLLQRHGGLRALRRRGPGATARNATARGAAAAHGLERARGHPDLLHGRWPRRVRGDPDRRGSRDSPQPLGLPARRRPGRADV